MTSPTDKYETFYARNRQEWRDWLEQNHATALGIRLILFKKASDKPSVDYDEAVEEGLCFGWIDSLGKRIDDQSRTQLFTPRKPRSPWSKSNKERVEKLIAQGLMRSAGLATIEIAKQNGAWDAADRIESLTLPDDLRAALDANLTARTYFEAFSASSRKNILRWIETAKRPETRAKRVEETVRLAAQNLKANH